MLKRVKLLLAALAMAAAAPAMADFPKRPVTVIVPYSAGGGTDVVLRIYQSALEQALGTRIVVEYSGGGATLIGTKKALAAPADGYTVLFTTSAVAINTITVEGKPYTMDDFETIAPIAEIPYALFVNDSQPFKDLPGLIKYAKANPGALNYIHLGQASPTRLLAVRLGQELGVELTPVAYPGAGPAQPDFYTNRVQMQMAAATAQYFDARNTVAIAVASEERLPTEPDVPTFKELGYPAMIGGTWFGVFAPKGIPAEARDKLRTAVMTAQGKVKKELADTGHNLIAVRPEEFRAYIDADLARWKQDLTRLGEKTY